MEDYTDALLSGRMQVSPAPPAQLPMIPEGAMMYSSTQITVEMLRRNPQARDALIQALNSSDDGSSVIVPWSEDSEPPENYIDDQIVAAVNDPNVDPFMQTTIFECLTGISDIMEDEGESTFRPSIFDSNDSDVLFEQLENGGFREAYDSVPAKYDHLSEEHLNMIYSNLDARTILSKLPKEEITEEFVEQLCSEA